MKNLDLLFWGVGSKKMENVHLLHLGRSNDVIIKIFRIDSSWKDAFFMMSCFRMQACRARLVVLLHGCRRREKWVTHLFWPNVLFFFSFLDLTDTIARIGWIASLGKKNIIHHMMISGWSAIGRRCRKITFFTPPKTIWLIPGSKEWWSNQQNVSKTEWPSAVWHPGNSVKLIFAEQGSPKRELILQPLSFLGYLQGDFWYIKAIWRKKTKKKTTLPSNTSHYTGEKMKSLVRSPTPFTKPATNKKGAFVIFAKSLPEASTSCDWRWMTVAPFHS